MDLESQPFHREVEFLLQLVDKPMPMQQKGQKVSEKTFMRMLMAHTSRSLC